MTLLALVLGSGCAVHYFNHETHAGHLWGLGHLNKRAAARPAAGPSATNLAIAFVTDFRTRGLNLGFGEDFSGVAAGWDARSRAVIRAPDAHFCLIWPANILRWSGLDFFTKNLLQD